MAGPRDQDTRRARREAISAATAEDHSAIHLRRLTHDLDEAERLRAEGGAMPDDLPPTLAARLHLLREATPAASALLDRPTERGATLRQLLALRVVDAGGPDDLVDGHGLDAAEAAIGADGDLADAIARELERPLTA